MRIAVVGGGPGGLYFSILMRKIRPDCEVTVYERSDRVGGHSNTVLAAVRGRTIPVDTGFIVFNRRAYPNLAALFAHLGVRTQLSDMSLAVSLNGGQFEVARMPLIPDYLTRFRTRSQSTAASSSSTAPSLDPPTPAAAILDDPIISSLTTTNIPDEDVCMDH